MLRLNPGKKKLDNGRGGQLRVCEYAMPSMRYLLSLHYSSPFIGTRAESSFCGIYMTKPPTIWVDAQEEVKASEEFVTVFEEHWRPFLKEVYQWLHCVGIVVTYMEWNSALQDYVPRVIDASKGRLYSVYIEDKKRSEYFWQSLSFSTNAEDDWRSALEHDILRYDPSVRVIVIKRPNDMVHDNTMLFKGYIDALINGVPDPPYPVNALSHQSQFNSGWAQAIPELFDLARQKAARAKVADEQARRTVYIESHLPLANAEGFANFLAFYKDDKQSAQTLQDDHALRTLFGACWKKPDCQGMSSRSVTEMLAGGGLRTTPVGVSDVQKQVDPRQSMGPEEWRRAVYTSQQDSKGVFGPPVRVEGTDNYMLGIIQKAVFPPKPPTIDLQSQIGEFEATIQNIYGFQTGHRHRGSEVVGARVMEMAQEAMRRHLQEVAGVLQDVARIAFEWGRDLQLGHVRETWKNMRRKARRERKEHSTALAESGDGGDDAASTDDGASDETVEVRVDDGDDDEDSLEADDAEANERVKTLLAHVGSRPVRIKFNSDYPLDIASLLAIAASPVGFPPDLILEMLKQQLHRSETDAEAGTGREKKQLAESKVGEKRKREPEPEKEKPKEPKKEGGEEAEK